MRKIEKIYGLPFRSLSVNMDDYNNLIDAMVSVDTRSAILVGAVAICYNSINLYNTLCCDMSSVADTKEDLKMIAEEIIFRVNDSTALSVESLKQEVSNVLDRMYPVVDTTKPHMVSYDSLFGGYTTPGEDVVLDINNKLHLVDKVFHGIRELYVVDPELVVYDSEDKSLGMR